MMSGVSGLRKELDLITNPPADAGLKWLNEQSMEVENLKARHPHAIELQEKCSLALCNLNCFMYALGISAESIHEKCDDYHYPGPGFVKHLLSSGFLTRVPPPSLSDTELIIYFDDTGCPTHAGLIQGAKVISKWGGGITHIWRHGLFEVPSSYGDCAGVFHLPAKGQAASKFLSWDGKQ